jgi:hypothetical protein
MPPLQHQPQPLLLPPQPPRRLQPKPVLKRRQGLQRSSRAGRQRLQPRRLWCQHWQQQQRQKQQRLQRGKLRRVLLLLRLPTLRQRLVMSSCKTLLQCQRLHRQQQGQGRMLLGKLVQHQ